VIKIYTFEHSCSNNLNTNMQFDAKNGTIEKIGKYIFYGLILGFLIAIDFYLLSSRIFIIPNGQKEPEAPLAAAPSPVFPLIIQITILIILLCYIVFKRLKSEEILDHISL